MSGVGKRVSFGYHVHQSGPHRHYSKENSLAKTN